MRFLTVKMHSTMSGGKPEIYKTISIPVSEVVQIEDKVSLSWEKNFISAEVYAVTRDGHHAPMLEATIRSYCPYPSGSYLYEPPVIFDSPEQALDGLREQVTDYANQLKQFCYNDNTDALEFFAEPERYIYAEFTSDKDGESE